MSDWGNAIVNSINWGQAATNSINWGNIYANSLSGDTLLVQSGFSNTRSIELDGADEYMTAGAYTSFDGQDKFSVSMWLKIPSGGGGYVLAKNNSSSYWGNRFNFFVDEGKIEVNTTHLAFRNTSLSLGNNWLNVIFVIDRTESTILDRCKVYVNGSIIVNSGNSNFAAIVADSEPLTIGTRTVGTSSPTLNNPFEGHIDEFSIFNIALDSTQAAAIGSTTPTDLTGHTGLINWWRFEEGSGTTVADEIGTNTGTLINPAPSSVIWSTDVPS